ncbi:MAG: diadenylate cyclase [Brevinematales bacterium]
MEALLHSDFSMWIRIFLSVVDILCVAYLFYFIYKLFEDTNSISIIKGFIAIIVLYAIAHFMELKTVEWIINYLLPYIVIMVVVLFQPEIRKFLTSLGQSGLSGLRGMSAETINEIVKAAALMSETKTGGLIIVEKNVGLKQLLEESVPLDAAVKAELLISIVHKGGILHDGAVLITGDRIRAARMIIPSVKVDARLKKKTGFGTRHLAGISVTSDSDAFSIIISEETGTISIANKGKIESDLTEEQFIRRINEVVGAE